MSDYLGRGVILAALTVSACACGLFLAVHGIVLLFAARVLQGVAVSAASSLKLRRRVALKRDLSYGNAVLGLENVARII